MQLPRELAVGDAIAYVNDQMLTAEGLTKKYTFSGSVLFDRMKSLGLYSTNISEIQNKVFNLGLRNIFS